MASYCWALRLRGPTTMLHKIWRNHVLVNLSFYSYCCRALGYACPYEGMMVGGLMKVVGEDMT